MELFKIFATIALNNSDANKALDETADKGQQTQSKLSKFFSGIGKGAVVAGKVVGAGLAAGATAMTGLVKKAMSAAGSLEQQIGGSEAVFGEYADSIQEKAKSAFSSMGLSTNEYLATANKMGSLFKGAGFETSEAMDITAKAMQRASDVASIMGIDTASAMESIAGAAKGNFTMMDNLGVAMNDTTLQAYALEKGIKKSTQQMTNQEKIGLAMEMFLEKTADYAGNYSKENETLAGSLGTAKAAFQNFLDGSGDVDGFVNTMNGALDSIVRQLDTLLPRLVTGLKEIVNKLAPTIPPLIQKVAPTIVEGAISLVQGIVDSLPVIIETILQSLPLLIDGVEQIFSGIIAALPQLTQLIVDALPSLLPQLVSGFVAMAILLAAKLPEIILPLLLKLPEICISLVAGIAEGMSKVEETLTAPFTKARDAIANIAEKIKSFFKGEITLPKIKLPRFSIEPSGWKIGDLLKGSIPKLGITWAAKGGIFDEPTLMNTPTGTLGVGEAGAEAVAPIDVLMGYVQTAVKTETSGLADLLERIIELLVMFFPQILEEAGRDIVLDDGTLVSRLAPKLNLKLKDIRTRNERGG